MGELEYLVGCTIKCDFTKKTLKISKPHLITKITQGFNKDVLSLVIFNTPTTLHNGYYT